MKPKLFALKYPNAVVPYIGTWIETQKVYKKEGLKVVVPYIGTWIETMTATIKEVVVNVVPYIGTWIETSI